MAQPLILSTTYFKIPEDRSALLQMISFDIGTALISFLCSESQLSSVGSKLPGFTKFSPVSSDFFGNFEGCFKTRLLCLGKSNFWKMASLSKSSLLLPSKVSSPVSPPHHHLWEVGALSPFQESRDHCKSSYPRSLNFWL